MIAIVIDIPNFKSRYEAELHMMCSMVDNMPQIVDYYFQVDDYEGNVLILDKKTSPFKYITIEQLRQEITMATRRI